jgi:hypothetical protein
MAPTDTTKCKCWKRPFEPPHGCFDYCAGKILRFANSDILQHVFKINEHLSEKIFEITSDEKLVKLSDFQPYFSRNEFENITMKITNLDDDAEKWLKDTLKNEMEAPMPVPA